MRLFSVLVIMLFFSFGFEADAALCQKKTAVVYSNGMFNSWGAADRSKNSLVIELSSYLQALPNSQIGANELEFHLAYADDRGANANTVTGVLTGIDQLYEVHIQHGGGLATNFWHWLAGIQAAPQWFQDAMTNMEVLQTALTYANDTDLQAMLNGTPLAVAQGTQFKGYKYLLGEGKRVLIVSHSQGNFYANAVYTLLAAQYGANIGNVQVATPASYVASGGPYTTVPEDGVMALIPGKLAASDPVSWQPYSLLPYSTQVSPTFVELGYAAWLNASRGHNFVQWYLAGSYTRDRIMGHIVQTISSLTFPVQTVTNTGPITVTLRWASTTDIDLHAFEPSGSHVYYAARQGLNGFLDIDNTWGYGPEHYYVSCSTIQAGTYDIGVNYYSGTARPENVTVTIATDDGGFYSYNKSLSVPKGSAGDARPAHVANIIVTANPDGSFTYAVQ